MRLREAMVLAIKYDAILAKNGRPDTLKIENMKFVPSEYRSKYHKCSEVKLSAKDCLSDDWYLMKNGKEFVPDGYWCYESN